MVAHGRPYRMIAKTSLAPPRMAFEDGELVPLALDRWLNEPPAEEQRLLDDLSGPVLDIGCGPGRHVRALSDRGIPTLGIDTSGEAVRLAWARRAPVLQRSIFDRLPGPGRWATALLLDGTVGIGGDPLLLLTRVRELLAARGCAVVETDGPGVSCRRLRARIEIRDRTTEWFPWARVGVDAIHEIALRTGFSRCRVVEGGERWFATLTAG
jgi:SAM-dependent methyltransferase